ncbi:MAG TPA: DUF3017 domain-containing protein [Trebonia sp.]|nr:DUF3017 domain-containing protein [Trebonia sp.]
MTPDMQQGRDGSPRSRIPRPDGDATTRSGAQGTEATPNGRWGAVARPPLAVPPSQPSQPSRLPQPSQAAGAPPSGTAVGPSGTDAGQAREDRSIVGVVPYLAVLVCAVVGVYVAWREGSAGGGDGAAVLGAALLAAAVARLLLPARLAGLLATRKRATDVLTLTVFGAGLLVAGLVLPR